MNGSTHVEPGMVIGSRTRILKRLGKGGACEVWRGSSGDGTEVAIKIPRADVEAACELVRREYRILSELDHPGIVPLVELIDVDGVPCLATGILGGGDLVPLLGTQRAYWLCSALQIAEALGYLHGCGWIHGDVKPRNVLFAASGNAILVDFSHATRIGDEFAGGGTLGYVRPGRTPEAAVADDVFAFAVTLYELVVGRLPFGDGSGAVTVPEQAVESLPQPGSGSAALDDLIIDSLAGRKNAALGSLKPFTDVLTLAVAELE